MENVLELLRIVLCWPVAVVTLCWLFGSELRLLLSETGKALGQRMKKATIGGAIFEFGEAQKQAMRDTVEKATAEFKDDPKLLAEFLNGQVRKVIGIRGEPTESETPLQGKRILWVDDKPDGNTYEMNLFRRLGAEVDSCLTTKDGVQALRDGQYDLIISDIYRRENGIGNRSAGYDLLDSVMSSWPGIPLIFYTNNSRISPIRGKAAFGATNNPGELSALVLDAAGHSA